MIGYREKRERRNTSNKTLINFSILPLFLLGNPFIIYPFLSGNMNPRVYGNQRGKLMVRDIRAVDPDP